MTTGDGMNFTIQFGWWLIPAAITILLFASCLASRKHWSVTSDRLTLSFLLSLVSWIGWGLMA